ncbi:hypothetical protein F2P56_015455 [Juglans regia]|uniref:pectinesterase n=2 Tax=Juglans regia TaxID=51240 RepID=A0A833XF01_JUGRE|nr:probable pectinesterase/pectinesterase inhibitor 21 [Juglans regia]KAF5465446.1 hypothetical protein F2P56_015455 [Juglans regia]
MAFGGYNDVSNHGHQKKHKKYAIIGVSSLLLVAMVAAVAVGATRNKADGSSKSDGNGEVSTSMKAVKAICQPTDYKETCEKSLSSAAGNVTDPKELIKIGFHVTVQEIHAAIANSTTLKNLAKDPRASQALENCKELLDYAIDDLQESFNKIGAFDVSKLDDYVADLQVWLSGAITYEQTCLDGFENTTGDAGDKMKEVLKTTQELTKNGLAMVTEISNVLTNLQIPGLNRRLLWDEDPSGAGFRKTYDEPHDKDPTSTNRQLLWDNGSGFDQELADPQRKPVEATNRQLLWDNGSGFDERHDDKQRKPLESTNRQLLWDASGFDDDLDDRQRNMESTNRRLLWDASGFDDDLDDRQRNMESTNRRLLWDAGGFDDDLDDRQRNMESTNRRLLWDNGSGFDERHDDKQRKPLESTNRQLLWDASGFDDDLDDRQRNMESTNRRLLWDASGFDDDLDDRQRNMESTNRRLLWDASGFDDDLDDRQRNMESTNRRLLWDASGFDDDLDDRQRNTESTNRRLLWDASGFDDDLDDRQRNMESTNRRLLWDASGFDDDLDDRQRNMESTNRRLLWDASGFDDDLDDRQRNMESTNRRLLWDASGFDDDLDDRQRNMESTNRRLLWDASGFDDDLDDRQRNMESTNRRLLWDNGSGFDDDLDDRHLPAWINGRQRKLLGSTNTGDIKADVVVAKDGSGKYKTINEALMDIPKNNNKTFVIYIKEGVYQEHVMLDKHMTHVTMIGDGPTKTKITGNKNFVDGTPTFKTATVSAIGSNFLAKNIGFENSAGAEKHQAVALRVQSDMSIFYNCQMDGYQDTLYAHTHRQFYRDCTISGTIDFIFGNAAAVFQNCKMIVRKPMDNQQCIVTAQGRIDRREPTALVLQGCTFTAEPAYLPLKDKNKAFLGRPWKQYSRTIIMQSHIEGFIQPEGWLPWMGDFALNTLFYTEIDNDGPGAATTNRVKWRGIKKVNLEHAKKFTAGTFIGGDKWIKPVGVPYVSGLM